MPCVLIVSYRSSGHRNLAPLRISRLSLPTHLNTASVVKPTALINNIDGNNAKFTTVVPKIYAHQNVMFQILLAVCGFIILDSCLIGRLPLPCLARSMNAFLNLLYCCCTPNPAGLGSPKVLIASAGLLPSVIALYRSVSVLDRK